MEIFPDAAAEFFYENDTSGEVWEHALAIGDPVPAEVLEKLRLFA